MPNWGIMNLPSPPVVVERRVDFSQTDAAGIMHFSTYFTFMEAAEAALFRQLGLSLLWNDAGKTHGFPRIDCQCRFRKPVAFDSLVRTEMFIEQILSGRIRYSFRFLDEKGNLCAEGKMTTACAIRNANGDLEGAMLPDSVRERLENWKNQVAES